LLTAFFYPDRISSQGNENFVNFHLKNETFQGGKLLTQDLDYYFDVEKGNLVVYGSFPQNHIKISNRLGEVKIYFPEKNSVKLLQNQFFSSENELIYYFLSNNFYDLGLAKEGFAVSDSHFDGKYQVVTWNSPVGMKKITKVVLVFENDHPVYSAYFEMNGRIVRKIFYYNYQVFRNFIMPMKVTQISYLSEKDSVIQRNTWSAIKFSGTPSSVYFNFKIPDDAKVSQ